MRYVTVQTKLWADEKFRRLPWHARMLWLYLLTSPHSNMIGFYWCPSTYMQSDTQLLRTDLDKAQSALETAGLARFDAEAQTVWLPNYLRHNPVRTHLQLKGAVKVLEELPRSSLFPLFIDAAIHADSEHAETWTAVLQRHNQAMPTPSVSHGNPVAITESESETESDSETETETRKRKPRKPEPAISEEAKVLAGILYHTLDKRGALPAGKGWFMRQAAIAENLLLKARPLEDWRACLEWALADNWWSTRITTLQQLGDKIWPRFAQRTGRPAEPGIPRALQGLIDWAGDDREP